MKKICLVSLLLVFSFRVPAQTFLSEGFSGFTFPPAGWTIDAHSANWSSAVCANAGGTPPEAMMAWSPSFTGITRLISPVIDLTGYTSVVLDFKQFLDDYDGSGYSIGVATRHDNGTWTTVWSVNPTGNVGPEERVITIANSDVGTATFQFCIYFNGTSTNIDYWYMDDIVLFIPYNLDGAMVSIATPKYLLGKSPVKGTFRNMGQQDITALDITWTANGTDYFTTAFTGLDLAFAETYYFLCTDSINYPIGSYNLEVNISNVNGMRDDNPANDSLAKPVNVASHNGYRMPAFEEFTSSTCIPCAFFNSDFVPWCENHADQITLVKYQMDWPDPGDPYYTAEGGVRRDFYGVVWVPWLECNGSYVNTDITAVQGAFFNAMLQPGLAKIAATHHLEGKVMTVIANVLPFAAFSGYRLQIIVVENTTTGNVGSNGETEFQHVMMKMMPNAYGTTVNLNDREPVSITCTQDLNGTNIEDFTDLSVVVLFQDNGSKEIYQSAYSGQDATFATEARCSGITIDGVPVPDFSPDVFDYTIHLPYGTSRVPVVAASGVDQNATVVVEPTWNLPGTTNVDCFGEDLMSHNRYTIDFEIGYVGEIEPVKKESLITVYPDPAKDYLMITGAENADIIIFSETGRQLLSVNDYSGNKIDISHLPEGIYLVQVVLEDKTILTRKMIVVK